MKRILGWALFVFAVAGCGGIITMTSKDMMATATADTVFQGLNDCVEFRFDYASGTPRDTSDSKIFARKAGLSSPTDADLVAPSSSWNSYDKALADSFGVWQFCIDTMFVWVFVDTVGTDTVLTTPASRILGHKILADSTVPTAALQDDAVTQAKVAAGAIGTTELENDAVTSAKIADLSVATADIGLLAVGKNQIALSAVDSTRADSSVVWLAKGFHVLDPDTTRLGAFVAAPTDSSDVAFHMWFDKSFHNLHGWGFLVPDWTTFRPVFRVVGRVNTTSYSNNNLMEFLLKDAGSNPEDSTTSVMYVDLRGAHKKNGIILDRRNADGTGTSDVWLTKMFTGTAPESSGARVGGLRVDASTVGAGVVINGNAADYALHVENGVARMGDSLEVNARAHFDGNVDMDSTLTVAIDATVTGDVYVGDDIILQNSGSRIDFSAGTTPVTGLDIGDLDNVSDGGVETGDVLIYTGSLWADSDTGHKIRYDYAQRLISSGGTSETFSWTGISPGDCITCSFNDPSPANVYIKYIVAMTNNITVAYSGLGANSGDTLTCFAMTPE